MVCSGEWSCVLTLVSYNAKSWFEITSIITSTIKTFMSNCNSNFKKKSKETRIFQNSLLDQTGMREASDRNWSFSGSQSTKTLLYLFPLYACLILSRIFCFGVCGWSYVTEYTGVIRGTCASWVRVQALDLPSEGCWILAQLPTSSVFGHAPFPKLWCPHP